MKRNVELNGLGPVTEASSKDEVDSLGKVRINEGDAWYVVSVFYNKGDQ